MNRYMYIGIISIAVGTLFMAQIIENDGLILIGAIMNAFGLFMMSKSSQISGKIDKSEIIEKIGDFKEEIINVKDSIKDEKSIKALESIEHEFDDWAESFVENYESKKVEHKKGEILLEEKEINLSNKWRHVYQYCFELIANMIMAYNQNSNDCIEVDLPKLPYNLFGGEAESFKGSIIFGDHSAWVISLQVIKPYKEDGLPSIVIHLYDARSSSADIRETIKEGLANKFMLLIFQLRSKDVMFTLSDMNMFVGDVAHEYSIDGNKYKKSFKDLFTSLIEFKLVKSRK